MDTPRAGVFRRAVILLTLTLLFGVLAVPAKAHKFYGQKPGIVHCDKFNLKDHTHDAVIENPSIKMYDGHGNLLSAKVAVAVVVEAELVVCVEVDAEADVDIVLEAVLDDDKNGKKDSIVVRVDVDAKADVNVKIKARVHGRIGLFVGVAVQADIDISLKGGDKKSYRCKGKDGYDQY